MVVKKRYWWVAFLLMLLNGVGYLYVGRITRFIIYFIFIVLFPVIASDGLSGRLSQVNYLAIFLIITFSLLIFFIIDASIIAKNSRNYTLQWFNKWWIYLSAVIVLAFIQILPDYIFGPSNSTYAVRVFSIPASSMAPTLQNGDYIITDARYYIKNEPKRGEVVVFAHPNNHQVFWVKRIIGLPGDRIQMIDGTLYINEKPISRNRSGSFSFGKEQPRQIPIFIEQISEKISYQTLDMFKNSRSDNTVVFEVPPGRYFALGDNRDNSADSRFALGFIPRENILYKATEIIWSRDWSRIGTSVN